MKYGPKRSDDLQVVRLWFKKPRIYEPGMMEDPYYHKFEDTELPVPRRAEECLLMQYGETWNVVPEDQDRDVHAFRIDFDISANNYYRLIDKAMDWESVYRLLDFRKQCEVKLLDKRIKLDEYMTEFREISEKL